jgi:metaxin
MKWVKKSEGALSSREEAYLTLVDGPVRRAWVYTMLPRQHCWRERRLTERVQQYHMYLTSNFRTVTTKCYIDPQSSSSIVRLFSSRTLQNAARDDLLKTKPIIDERAIYLEAEQAFIALDTYVSEGIKNGRTPTSLLDAAIFSYVYLLLELDEGVWSDRRLFDILKRFSGLREHKESIRKNHFRARPPAVWRQLNQDAR